MKGKIFVSRKRTLEKAHTILVSEGEEYVYRLFPDNLAMLGYSPYTPLRRKIGAFPIYTRKTPYSGEHAYLTEQDIRSVAYSLINTGNIMGMAISDGDTIICPPIEEFVDENITTMSPPFAKYLRGFFDKLFANAEVIVENENE
jgi:hypothetical protein